MDFVEYTLKKDDEDRRLDRILRKFINQENLSSIYKSLRKGLIKVNGHKEEASYRTQEGDVLKIASFLINNPHKETQEPLKNTQESSLSHSFPYDIVYKTEDLIFINKPYDIQVQGSSTTMDKKVQEYYKNTVEDRSLSFLPGPLHRLDRKTTGLLTFSWSLKGARFFSNVIMNHRVKKNYLGLCQGIMKDKERWIDNISQNTESTLTDSFHTVKVGQDGKEAITNAYPLMYGKYEGKDVTLVRYHIETGRTHQIRSQSANHGYPLLGDTSYGGMKIKASRDFFLHALSLEIEDKSLELPPLIKATPSDDFCDFLKLCFGPQAQDLCL